MAPLRFTVAGAVGTVVALAVAALCARLGVWQLDRLEQRRVRNERIAERLAAPPLVLTTASGDTAGLLFRPVEVGGEYDHPRSIVLAGRSHRGTPGVHLLTPLRLAGGGAVLVNRGWVPSADAATVDLSALEESGPIEIRGIVVPLPESGPAAGTAGTAARSAAVRVPEPGGVADDASFRRVWHRVDAVALRNQFPYPLAGYQVQALPLRGASGYPIRLSPPALDTGPHLGYAVQWFSFAAIALIGWLILAVRKGEVGRRPPSR